ncbi:hypothetical protein SB822_15275, partial [Paraburkholderia sp. SIMBA_054]
NRGAVTTVARKRQIGARYTDLCNNAHPYRNVAYVSDLGGTIRRVSFDGSDTHVVLRDAGNLTGIVAV